MPLTDLQRTRLKISDAPKWEDVTTYGDGTATVFGLGSHVNITSGSAFVPGAGASAWSATGATFNQSGFVALSSVVSANSAIRFTYVRSVFSDDEVNDFLTVGGTVLGAAIEAVGSLMFDALRCASWAASDGTSYNNTAAQAHARALYDKLQLEINAASTDAGGMSSWSNNQGNY